MGDPCPEQSRLGGEKMSFLRERAIPSKMVDETDVGEVTCPKCGKTLRIIHRDKTGSNKVLKHRVEEVKK